MNRAQRRQLERSARRGKVSVLKSRTARDAVQGAIDTDNAREGGTAWAYGERGNRQFREGHETGSAEWDDKAQVKFQ